MKQIIWFVKTYATFVVLFVLQKPLFLFLEKGSATQPVDNIFTELPAVIWHGLPLDLSMAGYLSVIPGFLSIAVVWLKRDLVKPIMNIYFIIASLFITCSFLLNASLYPYWKYPLDSTPLFYFFTSPADAIASVSIWQVILSIVILIVLTIGVWFTLRMRGKATRISSTAPEIYPLSLHDALPIYEFAIVAVHPSSSSCSQVYSSCL